MRNKIFIPLAAAALVASCTDDLNQYPNVETTSADLYQTVDQYESVLAKLYALYSTAGQQKGGENADLTSNMGYDFLRILFNLQEAGTDEVASTWLSGDKLSDLTYFSWDANDPWVADMYYRCYYTIAVCNEFLRNATESDIAGMPSADQPTLRTYRAEARYLRALSYYYVLDLYRKGPLVTEEDPVGAYVPSVSDASGLFSFLEKELKECSEDMSDRGSAVYGRAPRAAAWMLLTRLYLNAEVYVGADRFSDCIAYCQKVIDEGYTLESDYGKLFNADNDKRTNEIIYHIVVDATNVVSWGASTYIVCGAVSNTKDDSGYSASTYGVTSGWGSMRIRSQIPQTFDESDKRALFFKDGQTAVVGDPTDQTQGYLVTKWTNLTDGGETASNTSSDGVNTDYPVFRLAEAYLTLAEAVVRGGTGATKDDAVKYVNLVRERAGLGDITSLELTLDYVFKERTHELYWEAQRRTDLIRFGKFTTSDYLWDLKTGAVDNKYNYYPIPSSELTANPNLTNPEY